MRDFHLYCSAEVLFCFYKFHEISVFSLFRVFSFIPGIEVTRRRRRLLNNHNYWSFMFQSVWPPALWISDNTQIIRACEKVSWLKIGIWKDMRRQSLKKETKSDFNMKSKCSWQQSEQNQISFCLQTREENDSKKWKWIVVLNKRPLNFCNSGKTIFRCLSTNDSTTRDLKMYQVFFESQTK